MATKAAVWGTRNGLLLAAALVSSAVAWWMIAWPIASLSNVADHRGHFALTFAHMLGGTGMMFLGGLNLYLAARKDRYPLHRRVGQSYLGFGAFGAIMAIAINFSSAHKGGLAMTNVNISTTVLGLAWLAFAALGWRAALNKRFDSHAHWMVRSYVLVWSFVSCRIVSRISNIDDMGNGEAFIWLSWIAPLLVCEMALQWPQGARKSRPTSDRPG